MLKSHAEPLVFNVWVTRAESGGRALDVNSECEGEGASGLGASPWATSDPPS